MKKDSVNERPAYILITYPAIDRPILMWFLIFRRDKDMILEVDVGVDIFPTAAAPWNTNLQNTISAGILMKGVVQSVTD